MTRLAAFLICLAVAGCAAAEVTRKVDPGIEFTLAPGETAAVKSAGFKVRFVAVADDSRCPRDTTCIWAGEVKLQLDIVKVSQTMQVELREGDSTVSGVHRVTLVRVDPLPVGAAKILPQDYRATLRIDELNAG